MPGAAADGSAPAVKDVQLDIELARDVQRSGQQTLSGVYLEHEIRLDPERRRPLMDALIILTLGGEATPEHRVPWSRDPTSRSAFLTSLGPRLPEPTLTEKEHDVTNTFAETYTMRSRFFHDLGESAK